LDVQQFKAGKIGAVWRVSKRLPADAHGTISACQNIIALSAFEVAQHWSAEPG